MLNYFSLELVKCEDAKCISLFSNSVCGRFWGIGKKRNSEPLPCALGIFHKQTFSG